MGNRVAFSIMFTTLIMVWAGIIFAAVSAIWIGANPIGYLVSAAAAVSIFTGLRYAYINKQLIRNQTSV